jgi:LacI family transcriptional regulator
MPNASRGNPTVKDVARVAGVSVATVSRVLNGIPPFAAETEERVRAAVQSLGFEMHISARNLSRREKRVIGLLFFEIMWSNFHHRLIKGVEEACWKSNYDLLIYSTHTRSPNAGLARPIGEHNTDGILVVTDALDDAAIRRHHAHAFPVVLLYRGSPRGCRVPMVDVTNEDGSRQLVDHLIEAHGCKRIAFLDGPRGSYDASQRLKGYRYSLAAHGIPFDPGLVRAVDTNGERVGRVVQDWLKEGQRFDAIAAVNDYCAVQAIEALKAARRAVPRDVLVVGFDDEPSVKQASPRLTTAASPVEEVGKAATYLLVEAIHGTEVPAQTLLPTSMIIRRSCGCSQRGRA